MTVSTTDCMRMQIGPGGKLMALLPPAGDQDAGARSGNPPPSELAGSAARADELGNSWGAAVEVVPYNPGLRLPARGGPADLVPLLALLALAIVCAEWLVSGRLSAT